MITTLKFRMPEENEEFLLAYRGGDYRAIIDQTLDKMRAILKYEQGLSKDRASTVRELRAYLIEALEERGVL